MRIESGALISANAKLQTQLKAALMVLKFYADGGHLDIIDGRTRAIDCGELAEEILMQINEDSLDMDSLEEMISSARNKV